MATVAERSLSEEIVRVARLGHLTSEHLAAATGGDPSSARRWLKASRAPSSTHARRALELTALVERLVTVMDSTYVPVWLVKPIERLDGRRPVDAIREGDFRTVSRLVAGLEGMPVSQVPRLDVEERPLAGVFVRHIPGGGDPLYEPPDASDNRWQRGRVVEAWYFAPDAETAWAEWYRALAGTGLPPAMAMPRDLWRWEIALSRVALLDTRERLGRAGLPAPRPSATQWPAFQAVGESLFAQGCDGLLVVSAARPTRSNLVVFRTGPAVRGCTPIPPPDRHVQAPPIPTGLTT